MRNLKDRVLNSLKGNKNGFESISWTYFSRDC